MVITVVGPGIPVTEPVQTTRKQESIFITTSASMPQVKKDEAIISDKAKDLAATTVD